jgi:TPR repeat protein
MHRVFPPFWRHWIGGLKALSFILSKICRFTVLEVFFKLGFMFQIGRGVAQDKEMAIRWFRLAAGYGHEAATEALRKLEA